MKPNPYLKKLGFSNGDRLVIIHADDIGMCQASVSAYASLLEQGVISSAATMVPCPWFQAAAAVCREHPGADMGVHLTLNSEWDAYRWGPLSTRDPASGLLDDQGYFPRQSETVQDGAELGALQLELQTQVRRALEAGMDVTHVDTHMFTLAHPRLISAYVQTAMQHHLPMMIARMDESAYLSMGMDPATAAQAGEFANQLEEMGMPLIDHVTGMLLSRPENRMEQAKALLADLPVGITHFVLHPSQDTPELRAIAPDWRSRVGDYEVFRRDEIRTFLHEQGIHVIGYRAIKEAMPA